MRSDLACAFPSHLWASTCGYVNQTGVQPQYNLSNEHVTAFSYSHNCLKYIECGVQMHALCIHSYSYSLFSIRLQYAQLNGRMNIFSMVLSDIRVRAEIDSLDNNVQMTQATQIYSFTHYRRLITWESSFWFFYFPFSGIWKGGWGN